MRTRISSTPCMRMKNPFCKTGIILLLLSAAMLHADEQTTEESMSPDYKHEVYFYKADPSDDAPGYTLRIRAPGADEILYEEPAGGYVAWSAASSKYNYKCLWSPDSRFAAVFIRDTKRSGATNIYEFHGDKVQKVKLPDLDRLVRSHLTAEWRASWVTPEVWLPNHELLLTATGTQLNEEHGVYRFVLTLRLPITESKSATAKVVSFRQDRSIPFSIE